jgi:hypothetical protein
LKPKEKLFDSWAEAKLNAAAEIIPVNNKMIFFMLYLYCLLYAKKQLFQQIDAMQPRAGIGFIHKL